MGLEHTFKRAQRGLFAGERIKFLDSISEFGNRNRRAVRPNVQKLLFHSETLKRRLRIKATPTAVGLIEKYGGVDAYVLNMPKPDSEFAAALKERILLHRLAVANLENTKFGSITKKIDTQDSEGFKATELTSKTDKLNTNISMNIDENKKLSLKNENDYRKSVKPTSGKMNPKSSTHDSEKKQLKDLNIDAKSVEKFYKKSENEPQKIMQENFKPGRSPKVQPTVNSLRKESNEIMKNIHRIKINSSPLFNPA